LAPRLQGWFRDMTIGADEPEPSTHAPPPRSTRETEGHPHPSAAEARERGKMRKAASDHTQRALWRTFFAVLGALLVLSLVIAIRNQ
jgi:hypothetical protein